MKAPNNPLDRMTRSALPLRHADLTGLAGLHYANSTLTR